MRMFRLSGPTIATHVLKIQLRLEPELLLGQARGGVAAGHVAGPAVHDLVGDLFARDSLKCFHNLQHRHPLACAQVVDLYSMECWVNNLEKNN